MQHHLINMDQTNISDCINAKLEKYFQQLNGEKTSGVHKMVIQSVEPVVINFVLNLTNKNQSKAANILGISRSTLNNRIKFYKIN